MSIQKNEPMLVCDVMLSLNRFPVIRENVILKEALEEMGRNRLGIVCIINEEKKLFFA